MHDRFKFRVWDSSANAYVPRSHFILLSDGTLIQEIGGEEVIWELTEPEFCTGLKDKNGKLIYEKDLVIKCNDIYEVNWCHQKQGYIFRNLNCIDDVLESLDITTNDWQVIGNIHENADLLGA